MRILMVCTGNICRSPMAEGMLRTLLKDPMSQRVQVASAGTHGLSGYPAEPLAVRAAGHYGADIRAHQARCIDRDIIKDSDLILVMERVHRREIGYLDPGATGRIYLLGQFAGTGGGLEVEDPYGGDYSAYRKAADRIHTLLLPFMSHLGRHSR